MFGRMAMNQTQQIQKIVATFLKTDDRLIKPDTIIDRSVIKGSIMIHRMYAAITRELKCGIKDYGQIKTFAQLLEACRLGTNGFKEETIEIKSDAAPVGHPLAIG